MVNTKRLNSVVSARSRQVVAKGLGVDGMQQGEKDFVQCIYQMQ